MPTVVTGAAGFIGRHVVATLRARGHRVVGIDRRAWTPAPGELAVRGDLAMPCRDVLRTLRQADGVVHLAGRPGVRDAGPATAVARVRDNVLAGRVVCREVPPSTPLVVASSSSVYGGAAPCAGGHLRACAEDDALRPVGGYAQSKAALEQICARRADGGGTVAVVRPFTVAGEGQRPDMALSRWIAAALAGRPLLLLGDPDRRRDVTDATDVAEGMVRALERGLATTCNLGTGRTHRLIDLARCVADAVGVELSTTVHPAAPEEAPATRADTRRCAALLGFTPSTDLRALVARQIAAAPLTPATPLAVLETV